MLPIIFLSIYFYILTLITKPFTKKKNYINDDRENVLAQIFKLVNNRKWKTNLLEMKI